MNLKHWTLAGLSGAALMMAACTKAPPPPPPEPPPPAFEEPVAPPISAAPVPVPPVPVTVDTMPAYRARIQGRIGEVFRTIYFAFDQSSLTEEGKATAEAIGQLMKEAPGITVRIEGHADERGTNEYNLALGERRAQAVQQYLTSYGVEAGRISVLSYGEEKPSVEGGDESSWSKNRRAEFAPSF
ncbi:MAG: pal [Fibrobacteria bacterium]|jgi:peptidoglycan-associated lipoprotein|nr:pal [Fibrobacteria bacterium]